MRTIPIIDASAESACSAAEPFALMVLGDSMAPEFIDGDIVIAEPDGHASDGAYVVAYAEGDWTLRRLERDAAGWRLAPLNPRYPAVSVDDLNGIRGVVIQRSHPRRRERRKRYVE